MKKFLSLAALAFALILPISVKIFSLEEQVDLPVIMYHSIYSANNNAFVLSPKQLESDMKYLKDRGYTAVLTSDLEKFRTDKMYRLPSKPVIITFDDGCYNNYANAMPILKKYGMKGVVSVVGDFTDRAEKEDRQSNSYSSLKLSQMKEMQDSGVFEIGNHTYSLHYVKNGMKGARKMSWESAEQYKKRLSADLGKLQDRLAGGGIDCKCFAFPFGAYSKDAEEVLRSLGFRAAFTCNEKINKVSRTSNLFYLYRFNRPSGESSQAFFQKRGIV